MRLIIRVLLTTMGACEQALDEITNALRSDPKYAAKLQVIRKQQMLARSGLATIMDAMIDGEINQQLQPVIDSKGEQLDTMTFLRKGDVVRLHRP